MNLQRERIANIKLKKKQVKIKKKGFYNNLTKSNRKVTFKGIFINFYEDLRNFQKTQFISEKSFFFPSRFEFGSLTCILSVLSNDQSFHFLITIIGSIIISESLKYCRRITRHILTHSKLKHMLQHILNQALEEFISSSNYQNPEIQYLKFTTLIVASINSSSPK